MSTRHDITNNVPKIIIILFNAPPPPPPRRVSFFSQFRFKSTLYNYPEGVWDGHVSKIK